MFGERLRQLRLARGLTLEALAARMGGMITKQALSKYERRKARPMPTVLAKLAGALGVKAARLWGEPDIDVECIAYRRGSKLGKREREQVESLAKQVLEDRVRLQELTGQMNGSDLPVQALVVERVEDAESAAGKLRERWSLGLAPIASVVDVLEEHFVHVLEIDAREGFDGMSAVAFDRGRRVAAAAVVSRRDVSGERQRLNLTHELGHLVLNVAGTANEEKAAFRFGGAFLAPAEVVRREVGVKRSLVDLDELFLLRERFGMSIQALLYRLRDLHIITDSHYLKWCRDISSLGWRRREPEESKPERPRWLRRTVLRALVERVITQEEAGNMLGEPVGIKMPLSLERRRALTKLPLAERRRLLAEQAKRLAAHYEEERDEMMALQGGDIVEY